MATLPSVDEITPDDLAEVSSFQRAEIAAAGDAPPALEVEQLHWFLFENPETRADLPRGWVARDAAGRVVAVKFYSPERFRCGEHEYVLLMGGGYYVSATHRGLGIRLMRTYLQGASCIPFRGSPSQTSSNPPAELGPFPRLTLSFVFPKPPRASAPRKFAQRGLSL